MKRLEELTANEFKKLKASGLLKTIYPDAPENYVPVSDRPLLNKEPNWSIVIKQAEEIVKRIEDGIYHDDNDDEVYMLEAVMTTLYGDNFYEWKRKTT